MGFGFVRPRMDLRVPRATIPSSAADALEAHRIRSHLTGRILPGAWRRRTMGRSAYCPAGGLPVTLYVGSTVEAQRKAKNEAVFREVNERIEDAATEFGVPGAASFVCECSNASCTEMVQHHPGRVQRDPRQRPALRDLPGHEDLAIERLVDRTVALLGRREDRRGWNGRRRPRFPRRIGPHSGDSPSARSRGR